ncbi:TonB-dependent receptor [Sphingomonas sp.]|uniref:TonB-dependent receptor n=1 Tax=Sphingomonas sp. TaxID=28214 RepID=UPI002ED94AA9
MRRAAWVMTGLMAAPAAMAAAQDVPPPAPAQEQEPAPSPAGAGGDVVEELEGEEVVVTGQLRGAVPGDVKPELILNPADIRAYGVSSITELLAELEPQTRSASGGPPVLLLSGRPISGMAEIRGIPPEAIERIDILPEEAALKLGYRADQRVVNFVLRRRFRAITAEADASFATAGGRDGQEFDFGLLRINRDGRINIEVEYERESRLLESDRDIITEALSSPFDRIGNIRGLLPNGEIDPALSALAGTLVTTAGAPAAAAAGAVPLGSFAAGANRLNQTDLSPYRTLQPQTENLAINAVLNRAIGKVSATATLRLEQSQSESLLGLPSATLTLPGANPFSPFAADTQLYRYYDQFSPLERSSNNRSLQGGFSLNGDLSPRWRWSVTGNWERSERRTLTDTGVDTLVLQSRLDAGDPAFNPFGAIPADMWAIRPADRSNSVSNVGSVNALVSGPLAKLPAGEISTSLRVAGRTNDLTAQSLRRGLFTTSDIGRDTGSVRANIDLPIASRSRAVLSALGNLSLNANVELEELSDFGTLLTYGYGANWSPIDGVRFLATFTEEEGAPSAQQLGDAVVATPNVRVFDFVRGETVDITRIEGGNPNLLASDRSAMKLGLNVRPIKNTDLSFNVDYNKSTIRNLSQGFPAVTAEIEAAFPGRFVRDGSGRLLQIDNRPVNFLRSEREEVRWGINFSKQISSPLARQRAEQMQAQRAARQAAREAAREAGQQGETPPTGERGPGEGPRRFGEGGRGPGAGFGGRGGGFRGGLGGGGANGGRFQLGLFHTIALTDRLTIREGLPVLDRLNGAAFGSRGGAPRHEVELRAGVVRDGIGLRVNADWRSATRVRGGTAGAAEELRFDDMATVNLRLFANLSPDFKFVRDNRWLAGTRITLSIDNLFDQRLRVTDETGATPLSHQPAQLDPVGRTVQISIRKMFF